MKDFNKISVGIRYEKTFEVPEITGSMTDYITRNILIGVNQKLLNNYLDSSTIRKVNSSFIS